MTADMGCVQGGEHPDLSDADLGEGVARMSEGICPECHVPGFLFEGWSCCPCCRVDWRVSSTHVTFRLKRPLSHARGES